MTTDATQAPPRHRRLDGGGRDLPTVVLVVLFLLVPSSFVGLVLGPAQLTGLAWAAGLLLTVPLAVSTPVPGPVLRRLWPYLLFASLAALSLAWTQAGPRALSTFVQLMAPLPAFLVATRVVDAEAALRQLGLVARGGIGLATLLVLADRAGVLPAALPLSARPMAIALVPLFVVATVRVSRSWTAVLGAAVLLSAVVTGSRTGAVVLLVVVLLSPSWRLGYRGRIGLGLVAVVAVVAFSTTQAFRDRFFFSDDATLRDALTGSAALNTAGRRELWPRLYAECAQTPWLGQGTGSGSEISSALTLGVLAQPHNDYLRIWCDTGLVGSVPFWLTFAAAGVGGLQLARRGRPVGAASGQLVVALLTLALTDNVVVYTAYFMVPLAVVLGLAAAESDRRPVEPDVVEP